jgi:hypothetical protein
MGRLLKRDKGVCWKCGYPLLPRPKFTAMRRAGQDSSEHKVAFLDYVLVNEALDYKMGLMRAACEDCVSDKAPVPWLLYDKKMKRDGKHLKRLENAMLRHGNRCWMCNRPVKSAQDLRDLRDAGDTEAIHIYRMATIDHFEPVSLGGRDIEENKRVACWQCNMARGHAMETDKRDWMTWLPDDYEEMKVVFLDFWGTIVNGYDAKPPEIRRLNAITDLTDAVIVIASDIVKKFRPNEPSKLPYARNLLTEWGAEGTVIGCTHQNYSEGCRISTRPMEILSWLEEHPRVTSYVILDDLPLHDLEFEGQDYSLPSERATHFIQVRGLLSDTDAEQAIQILGG